MSALIPDQARAMRKTAAKGEGQSAIQGTASPHSSLAARWEDLHDQAMRLAQLADLSPEPFAGPIAAFPERIGDADEWQRELAWQGLEDIDAMMRPGLAALATLTQRGMSANAPALALWREFYDARGAVMALASAK
ncbi:MAG: hypothetical protein AAF559_04945 [Pseudomonadota bacterium]